MVFNYNSTTGKPAAQKNLHDQFYTSSSQNVADAVFGTSTEVGVRWHMQRTRATPLQMNATSAAATATACGLASTLCRARSTAVASSSPIAVVEF